MERQFLEHGFGPFYRPDSQMLILGSFPSVKSREASFFYGHPQNRFWPLLARLCDEAVPHSIEDKIALLERSKIALYDVIERCSIVGSADSTIRDVEPANLQPILSATQIGDRVFTNGGTAYSLYQKHLAPVLGISATRLPSTSPANAACTADKLFEQWSQILSPILRRLP